MFSVSWFRCAYVNTTIITEISFPTHKVIKKHSRQSHMYNQRGAGHQGDVGLVPLHSANAELWLTVSLCMGML